MILSFVCCHSDPPAGGEESKLGWAKTIAQIFRFAQDDSLLFNYMPEGKNSSARAAAREAGKDTKHQEQRKYLIDWLRRVLEGNLPTAVSETEIRRRSAALHNALTSSLTNGTFDSWGDVAATLNIPGLTWNFGKRLDKHETVALSETQREQYILTTLRQLLLDRQPTLFTVSWIRTNNRALHAMITAAIEHGTFASWDDVITRLNLDAQLRKAWKKGGKFLPEKPSTT